MTIFELIRWIFYLLLGSLIVNKVPSPYYWYAIIFLVITEVLWKLEYNRLVYTIWELDEKIEDLKNDKTTKKRSEASEGNSQT